jgi:uncharacterized protein YjbJ (UPF0337 family)
MGTDRIDSTIDHAKGAVKEKAGALTGDRDLENEGRADRAKADVKDAANAMKDGAEKAVDAVKEGAEKVVDAVTR